MIHLSLDLFSNFSPQHILLSLDDLQLISDTPQGRCSGGRTISEMAQIAPCSSCRKCEASLHFPLSPRINVERCLHWLRKLILSPPGFLGPGLFGPQWAAWSPATSLWLRAKTRKPCL